MPCVLVSPRARGCVRLPDAAPRISGDSSAPTVQFLAECGIGAVSKSSQIKSEDSNSDVIMPAAAECDSSPDGAAAVADYSVDETLGARCGAANKLAKQYFWAWD